tara:strand:+ start:15314 stop:15445 length:132 start_codon:yes stop_codon:yes gene_type:complete
VAEDKLVLELLEQQIDLLQSIRLVIIAIGIAVIHQWIRGGKKK